MFISLAKLGIFAAFIAATIEVIKVVAAKGLLLLVKEVVVSLWRNTELSAESVKVLNFVIALIYCKVFHYGVMQDILGLTFNMDNGGSMQYFLDYVGTSSVVFMGAGWFYDKIMEIKKKIETPVVKK